MRVIPKVPRIEPRDPDGICQHCGAAAVPFGRYCPGCYGSVLHPEGLPLEPGDPDDPYRAFNAQADAYLLDQRMPAPYAIGEAIEYQFLRRLRRRDC